jgi:radical SAM superfamily enzyme YgiQ (UPF0313 family)
MLIALDWTRPKDPPLSLGHASILALAKQHKIDVTERSWSVSSESFRAEQVAEHILSFNCASLDVALGVYVWNEAEVRRVLDLIDKQFRGRIILGGPQISHTKGDLENLYPHADIFIRGFAESAIVELSKVGDTSFVPKIHGVHFAGEIDCGELASVDLEQLPSPYLNGIIKPQRFIRWETQRGCKFRCSFCQHREPGKPRIQTKAFSMNRIHSEAQWILDNPVIQDVAVLDPVFNSGPYYLDVLQHLHGNSGKLALQSRMEMVNENFLNEILKINETGNVVLEFGLQTIHKNEMQIIGRGNNMTKVAKTLNDTREMNISSEISLIFGLPEQTYISFKESVEYCISHRVKIIHAFPLMLLRGTPLHDNKEILGLVESNEIASEYIPRVQSNVIPHVVQSNSFDYNEWKKMAALAERLEREYNVYGKIDLTF